MTSFRVSSDPMGGVVMGIRDATSLVEMLVSVCDATALAVVSLGVMLFCVSVVVVLFSLSSLILLLHLPFIVFLCLESRTLDVVLGGVVLVGCVALSVPVSLLGLLMG